jgi:hypothetical protein
LFHILQDLLDLQRSNPVYVKRSWKNIITMSIIFSFSYANWKLKFPFFWVLCAYMYEEITWISSVVGKFWEYIPQSIFSIILLFKQQRITEHGNVFEHKVSYFISVFIYSFMHILFICYFGCSLYHVPQSGCSGTVTITFTTSHNSNFV